MQVFNSVVPFRAVLDQQKKPPQPIKMAKKGDAGEIFIYDSIGASFFEDGVTAKGFAKDLKALGSIKTLDVYLNSPGGSVFEGVAIHNILARHPAQKTVHIDGLAASIASVVALAGDQINIAENGLMMIHNPWSVAIGDAEEMRKAADSLDKIREGILSTYVNRTTADEGEIINMMDAETWMTAKEAVEFGFADAITESADVAAMTKFNLSIFQNAPPIVAEASPKEQVISDAKLMQGVAGAISRLAQSRAKQRVK